MRNASAVVLFGLLVGCGTVGTPTTTDEEGPPDLAGEAPRDLAKATPADMTQPRDLARPKKGIGDACASGTDCLSGLCSNAGGGYCTRSCTSNTDCAGTPQINNEFGQLNYCVKKNSTSNICVPGCDYNNSMCASQYGAGFDCYPLNGVDFCLKP